MARAYNVIDADGHILEPLDLWQRYMDPAYRDQAPTHRDRPERQDAAADRRQDAGQREGAWQSRRGRRARRHRRRGRRTGIRARPQGRLRSARAHPRHGLDGIDAAFLYPSIGLFAGAVEDVRLSAAICRAYNRWLADYCKPYPDRLFGVAMLPLQSVELAIEEMRFARSELGMKGVFVRPNPYSGKMIHHPDYDRFWSAAEELDVSIGFHEGGGGSSGMPQVGLDRFETRGARHIVTHTMEMMMACLAVVWGGVCDRHPKIRIGFLEGRRRLDRALARAHGPALRRPGF